MPTSKPLGFGSKAKLPQDQLPATATASNILLHGLRRKGLAVAHGWSCWRGDLVVKGILPLQLPCLMQQS